MDIEYIRLIFEVEKRRALWTKTRAMHHMHWPEVSRAVQMEGNWKMKAPEQIMRYGLNCIVPECKPRFWGLRNVYRNEIRKIQQKRAERSTWSYFQALEILRNVVDPSKLAPCSRVPFPPNIGDYTIIDNNRYPNGVGSGNIGSNLSMGRIRSNRSNWGKSPQMLPFVPFIAHTRTLSNDNTLKFRTEITRVLMDHDRKDA
ncbi:uncharacterized protein LOC135440331 [Drosophila montana]|uniref:uncharacterized protein LOC135440331 n=1 Tax=Drosophila montana TaxID=40370 RepID=UPI00313B797A